MDAPLHNSRLRGFLIKLIMWYLSLVRACPFPYCMYMMLKANSVTFSSFYLCVDWANWSLLVCFVGTTKTKNLDANIGSLSVKLTREDIKEISDMIPVNAAAGDRVSDSLIRCSWKFANTPPKHGKTPFWCCWFLNVCICNYHYDFELGLQR